MSARFRFALGAVAVAATSALSACGDAAKPTPGVVGDTITVGIIAPLSDAVAVIGTPITAGMQAYFESVNARGGIGGRYQIRTLVEDQTYANPSTSAQKYQKIKDEVALFGIVLGTDHINTLLPLLAEDSVLVGPATFDDEWVREPFLIPWGSTYQLWAYNAIAYYRETAGNDKRICSMALATGYGDAGLGGVALAAKNLGFQEAASVRFRQDDQDFVAQITQLRNARCDAVLLVSLPANTGRILGTAAQARFAPQWIALSPGWHPAMLESPLRDYLRSRLWISYDGAEWGDMAVPRMQAMMSDLATYRPQQKPDLYFLAGYAMAVATEAVLTKAAELGDLSRGGIVRASEAMGAVDFGGLIGDYAYGPADQRQPPRSTNIFRPDPANAIGLTAVRKGYSHPGAADVTFTRAPR
jgi:ABC-type branched-subunit amino acid transport system substrate-binding protein